MGLHDSMTELDRLRNKVQWSAVFMVAGMCSFAVLPLFNQFWGIFLGIGLFVYGITTYNKSHKDFKALYKRIFVEAPLQQNFENVIYSWQNGFDENIVRNFELCKMGNRFRSEDYIRASYSGVPFEISDVYVAQHTSSGRSSHTTIYFKGRMMVFAFPEKLVSTVRVYSDTFRYRQGEFLGMHPDKVEMESVTFNKQFDVIAPDAHEAFYLLTPHFMEKLLQLKSKYTSVAIHVCGNQVAIGFNEPNNDAFDVKNISKQISYPEEMDKIQGDINDIKEIIGILRDISQAGNGQAGGYQAGYNQAGGSRMGVPYAGGAYAGNAYVGNAYAGNTYVGNPSPGDPYVDNPYGGNSYVENPPVGEPQMQNYGNAGGYNPDEYYTSK